MATTTRGSLHRKGDKSVIYAAPHFAGSNLSLTHLQCRTPSIGRESHLLKNVAGREKRTMRLARLKPGFVIGTLGGQFDDYTGDHVALTVCRLHCLSYDKINEMEEQNPRLILELYKMMVSKVLCNVFYSTHVIISYEHLNSNSKGQSLSEATRDHN
jgi:CRP-like cAMP-binding protein